MLTRRLASRCSPLRRAVATALALAGAFVLPSVPASALGTVRIQHPDGSVKTYSDVRIAVRDESMWITSSDGKGTVILGKAACTRVGELVRCLPYDATLKQFGETTHIALQTGTVWINPTQSNQQLSHSSTQLPPHGVLLSVRTKRGTYVSLTGTLDEVAK